MPARLPCLVDTKQNTKHYQHFDNIVGSVNLGFPTLLSRAPFSQRTVLLLDGLSWRRIAQESIRHLPLTHPCTPDRAKQRCRDDLLRRMRKSLLILAAGLNGASQDSASDELRTSAPVAGLLRAVDAFGFPVHPLYLASFRVSFFALAEAACAACRSKKDIAKA